MEKERARARPIPERFSRPALLAGFEREFVNIRSANDPQKARDEWLKNMRKKTESIFQDSKLVAPALENLENLLVADDDTFPQIAADTFSRLFQVIYNDPHKAERFHEHLREEERLERKHIVEAAKGIVLSPEQMLYGMFDADDASTFRIHIAGAKTLEPVEKLVDFRKGMRELARRLKDDPEFLNVKTIVGTSWIVGEHPNVARGLGFTLDEEPLSKENALHFGGETRRVQRAWMTSEAVISKYLPGNSRQISSSG